MVNGKQRIRRKFYSKALDEVLDRSTLGSSLAFVGPGAICVRKLFMRDFADIDQTLFVCGLQLFPNHSPGLCR